MVVVGVSVVSGVVSVLLVVVAAFLHCFIVVVYHCTFVALFEIVEAKLGAKILPVIMALFDVGLRLFIVIFVTFFVALSLVVVLLLFVVCLLESAAVSVASFVNVIGCLLLCFDRSDLIGRCRLPYNVLTWGNVLGRIVDEPSRSHLGGVVVLVTCCCVAVGVAFFIFHVTVSWSSNIVRGVVWLGRCIVMVPFGISQVSEIA